MLPSFTLYDLADVWRTDTTAPATSAAWTPTGVNAALVGPTVTA